MTCGALCRVRASGRDSFVRADPGPPASGQKDGPALGHQDGHASGTGNSEGSAAGLAALAGEYAKDFELAHGSLPTLKEKEFQMKKN